MIAPERQRIRDKLYADAGWILIKRLLTLNMTRAELQHRADISERRLNNLLFKQPSRVSIHELGRLFYALEAHVNFNVVPLEERKTPHARQSLVTLYRTRLCTFSKDAICT